VALYHLAKPRGLETKSSLNPRSFVRSRAEARPFLKWAGGKSQLLSELFARVPRSFGRYFEPFLGGGALFFALQSNGHTVEAYLSDANAKLIDTYRAVRDEVETVIAELTTFANDREAYYTVRAMRPDELGPALRAARFIYLNKTCYNGLYRENQRGEFNVPFGRYKNPRICDAEKLRAAALTLREVQLECHDFGKMLDMAKAGDFVYLDPPYDPLSATSSFTSYHEDGFGEEEQRRLAATVRELDRHGVYVVLSNSDTQLIRELYKGLIVDDVQAARAINSKAERRGKIGELIVRNYRDLAGTRAKTAGRGGC